MLLEKWSKNRFATNLTSTSDAVNSISVDGNNIYCGGYYTPSSKMACYWKNNNIIPLNNSINASSSLINSIFLDGVIFSCGSYIDSSSGNQNVFTRSTINSIFFLKILYIQEQAICNIMHFLFMLIQLI